MMDTRQGHRLLSVPLALVVAFLAHTAEFGSSHTFGGVYGFGLIAAALATLALTAIVTPITAALSVPDVSRRSLASFTARLGLDLSTYGISVYAGMECLEGHAPALSAGSVALLLASALVVALATLLASDGLTRVGHALAASLHETVWKPFFALRLALYMSELPSCAVHLHQPSRGRAPPFTI